MRIPEDFFKAEEREGFLISSMMKRAWAAQMELLSMMAEIFARHSLTWWVDFGTLVGVVRHRGYVPWDDDIDISMPRADYEEGLRALREELPDHCQVRRIEFEYLVPWAVVSNRFRTDIGENPAEASITERFHGFPYICNIDIHPLDYVPKSHAEREYLFQLLRVVDGTAYYYHDYEASGVLGEYLDNVEQGCGRKLPRDRDCQVDLYYLFDELCGTYAGRKEECCGLAMMDEWVTRDKPIRPLACYEETVWLPFEMIEVPVPAGYQQMLGLEYGDWTVPVRGATHDYPFYAESETQLKQVKLGRAVSRSDALLAQGQKEEAREVLLKGIGELPERYELYYFMAKSYVGESLGHVYAWLVKGLALCDDEEDRAVMAGELERVKQAILESRGNGEGNP